MDFSTAIEKMKEGHKVTRKNWLSGDFLFIKDNDLYCDGGFIFWSYLRPTDLKAKNWIIYEERFL